MGKVIIQEYTTKEPISLMGEEAGVCVDADTKNPEKNFTRGVDCIKSRHGRVMEYPQIYMVLEGYSARVIREFYTHIGGMPTRIQASSRYIDYESGFEFVTPPSIEKNDDAKSIYNFAMASIRNCMKRLEAEGIPREDIAMILPLAMQTKVVVRTNFRNLMDMSRQRMCTRAYWEFRELMHDIIMALNDYSDEWKLLTTEMKAKCQDYGYCTEKRSCGAMPKK